MYVSCNFDQAWAPRKLSPWCALFSDKSLEAMEYREDLEYYWIDGPGRDTYSPFFFFFFNLKLITGKDILTLVVIKVTGKNPLGGNTYVIDAIYPYPLPSD